MFRISFVILAMASAMALNGCSQCAQQPAPEATAPAAAPMETAPAAPTEAMPADGTAATPVEAAPEATPAAH